MRQHRFLPDCKEHCGIRKHAGMPHKTPSAPALPMLLPGSMRQHTGRRRLRLMQTKRILRAQRRPNRLWRCCQPMALPDRSGQPGGAASRLKQIPMYSGICRKQSREAYSVRGIAPGKRTFLFRSRLPAYSRAPRLRLPGSRSGASRIPSLPVQMCSNAASSSHTVPRRTGRAVLSHQERKSPKGTGQV